MDELTKVLVDDEPFSFAVKEECSMEDDPLVLDDKGNFFPVIYCHDL